ncbi:hypothetical protein K1W69_10840 [Hoeflea sp. WL0058]|uniref:Uncharacterized protein n=1 Tax=Flavimaribacter sediminis TaxID=2865987 RepID=A0AAE2ZJG8_9HYPH|nr:hypothetical protein [Flavimaribacter sediminis]MBW8637683.1 hypothetical protein [Flavimaribacter sediminis]
MNAFRILLAACLFSFFCATANANVVEGTFSGNSRVVGVKAPTDGAVMNFDWEAEARLGLLMGEPVASIRFKWDNPSGILTIPVLTLDGRGYDTIRFGQLPQDLQEKPRLVDVRIRLTVSDGSKLMHIISDVGITGKPGEWSFNVPGSPDWDELLLFAGTDTYLEEEAARAAWANGLTITDAVLVDATLSLYDLHDAYMNGYEHRERYRALGAAFKRLSDGLYRSYGIDVQNIDDGWTDAYFVAERSGKLEDSTVWSERLGKLEKVIEKLSSLPDALRAGDNHAPYAQAQQDAETIRRAARHEARAFTPAGVDPNGLQKGSEPNFTGSTAIPAPQIVLRFSRRLWDKSKSSFLVPEDYYRVRTGRLSREWNSLDSAIYVLSDGYSYFIEFANSAIYSCDSDKPITRVHRRIECPVAGMDYFRLPLFNKRPAYSHPYYFNEETRLGEFRSIDEIDDGDYVFFPINGLAIFERIERPDPERDPVKQVFIYELDEDGVATLLMNKPCEEGITVDDAEKCLP